MRGKESHFDPNTYIYFTKPENFDFVQLMKIQMKSDQHKKYLYLYDPSIDYDIFKFLPRLFTITTTNCSYKFNVDILKEASPLIQQILKENPANLQYNLQTEDELYVMKKYEQLFLGEKVNILKKERQIFSQISDELQLTNFSLNPTIDSSPSNFTLSGKQKNIHKYQMNIKQFFAFVIEKMSKTLKIRTKKNEYMCNIAGANSSKLIYELFSKNPNLTEYEYDFDDELDEFKLISDFFNFQKVPLTADNMYLLKKIADDLQIDCIINDIDSFIDDYENRVQTIDDHQSIIDSINELFENLFKIKEITVPLVKNKIIESNWVKTEENVQELVAFIIQAISVDVLLHPYLADLIELLDKESKETPALKILVPFIVKKLMNLFADNNLICAFVYILYKRKMIEKDKIMKKLKDITIPNKILHVSNIIIFLPEIYELLNNDEIQIENYLFDQITKNVIDYILSYSKDNFEKFKLMRDKGEPDDKITIALRNDDVDTLQSIVTINNINIEKETVPFNIFEGYLGNKITNYIDYAAFYGSLKCFKYLLLNHAVINDSSLICALYGANTEIIQIIDQRCYFDSISDLKQAAMIIPTIERHNNNLFDWFIENKCKDIIFDNNRNRNLLSEILNCATKNGDIYSISAIIDKGFDLSNLKNKLKSSIESISKNGFYKLLQFFMVYSNKVFKSDNLSSICDSLFSVSFGNISIFKLILQHDGNIDLYECLKNSIQFDSKKIYIRIIDNLMISDAFNESNIYDLLNQSIECDTNYYFIDLINRFRSKESKLLLNFTENYISLLSESCKYNKIEISEMIINFISDDKCYQYYDFSKQFSYAVANNSVELCNLFINKKVFIDYDLLALKFNSLKNANKETLDLIINNITPYAKETIKSYYLDIVIKAKNKVFIQFLLNENAECDSALFEAVKTNDIEIVNIILNYNSKPSFINQISDKGTALNLAVEMKNLQIVKRLLSIPEIDPSLYKSDINIPLVTSVANCSFDIMNSILDFYGPNIASQQYQLNEAFKQLQNNLHYLNIKYIKDFDKIFCKFIDLIKQNLVDINLCTSNGNNAFMNAIYSTEYFCEKIYYCEKLNINHRNNIDETALIMAVRNKMEIVVNFIIKHKNFDPIKSHLNYAFYLSTYEISKILASIKCLDINYRKVTNKSYTTPLISAVENNDIDKINLIIHHSSFDSIKSDAKNAVLSAFLADKMLIFDILIPLINNNVNITGTSGLSLLEISINNKRIEIVRKILSFKEFDPRKSHFLKAFYSLLGSHIINYEIIKLLIEHDKKHDKLIDYKSNLPNGKSLYTTICMNDKDISESSMSKIGEIIELFINNGCDPNLPDQFGIYPLQYAISLNKLPYVKALLDSGKIDLSIKVKEKNNNETTFLHLAARSSNSKILSYFLDNELIDINVTDSYGNTPLIDARRYRRFECISQLFQHDDLDFKHRNNYGEDAFDILPKFFKNIDVPKTKEEYLNALLSNENISKNKKGDSKKEESKTEDENKKLMRLLNSKSLVPNESKNNQSVTKIDFKNIDFKNKKEQQKDSQTSSSSDEQNESDISEFGDNKTSFTLNFKNKKEQTKNEQASLNSDKQNESDTSKPNDNKTSFTFNFNNKKGQQKDSQASSNSDKQNESNISKPNDNKTSFTFNFNNKKEQTKNEQASSNSDKQNESNISKPNDNKTSFTFNFKNKNEQTKNEQNEETNKIFTSNKNQGKNINGSIKLNDQNKSKNSQFSNKFKFNFNQPKDSKPDQDNKKFSLPSFNDQDEINEVATSKEQHQNISKITNKNDNLRDNKFLFDKQKTDKEISKVSKQDTDKSDDNEVTENDEQQNEYSHMQDEISASILDSFDYLSPEQVKKISKTVFLIAKKQANKMASDILEKQKNE